MNNVKWQRVNVQNSQLKTQAFFLFESWVWTQYPDSKLTQNELLYSNLDPKIIFFWVPMYGTHTTLASFWMTLNYNELWRMKLNVHVMRL